jgi:carbon storage regulator CsrA
MLVKTQGETSLARVVHYHFSTATTGSKDLAQWIARGPVDEPVATQYSENWRLAMLVLTRKKSEMIRIGDNVVIKVISAGNGKVKIGIEAPNDVRVVRAELSPEPEAPMIPTQTLRDRVLARRHVATAK